MIRPSSSTAVKLPTFVKEAFLRFKSLGYSLELFDMCQFEKFKVVVFVFFLIFVLVFSKPFLINRALDSSFICVNFPNVMKEYVKMISDFVDEIFVRGKKKLRSVKNNLRSEEKEKLYQNFKSLPFSLS